MPDGRRGKGLHQLVVPRRFPRVGVHVAAEGVLVPFRPRVRVPVEIEMDLRGRTEVDGASQDRDVPSDESQRQPRSGLRDQLRGPIAGGDHDPFARERFSSAQLETGHMPGSRGEARHRLSGEDLRPVHRRRGREAMCRCNRVRIPRGRIVHHRRIVGHLELRFHGLRIGRRKPLDPDSLRAEQVEQGVEGRHVPCAGAGQEPGRTKVAREPRFLLEPLEGREALPRESNADPGFVVLPDEGAAVPCRPRGDMVLLEEDDVVVAPPNALRIALNDAVPPSIADVPTRILVSGGSLQGYASMDEKSVPQMETDEEKQISAALLDRDVVLILGGLGGELGGWGMGLVGRVARILGDTTLALATIPFGLEGPIRRGLAEAQFRLLQRRVDGVVTFGNDPLLQVAKDLPMSKAFAALSAIMARPASNLPAALGRADVAPLRKTLARVKDWRYGMGVGREKHRCFVAVEEAYASPWFTPVPEEIRHAIVLMSVLEAGTDEGQLLHG